MELSSHYFVGKQNLPDLPQLDDEDDDCEDDDCEDDDCEDDDQENSEDVKKITACLPYHISISLPDNGNFCDLTFRHGHTVGSLLTCNGSDVTSPYSPTYGVTEAQRMTDDDAERVTDNMEDDTEFNRECLPDATGPISHNKANDSMEHSTEHDVEQHMEHTQGYTTQELTENATSHTRCDPQLSINEYLRLCVKHLNYTEHDVRFANSLYDTIHHAGEMGVPRLHLEQV